MSEPTKEEEPDRNEDSAPNPSSLYSKIKHTIHSSGIEFFPLRHTLKNYSFQKARADLKSAINVALLDFPQGMAYAMIAGLPVQFGLYCSALSSITGPMLASSRFIMLGPTNATAVLLLSALIGLNLPPGVDILSVLPLLLLMVGVFMILGAFLRVAALTQYISRSVVTGYISAAALLIIVNQFKYVFQLDIPRASSFIKVFWSSMTHLTETHIPSMIVGIITLAIYIPTKKYLKALPNVAITLVLVAIAMPLLKNVGIQGVERVDAIPMDGWPISVPVFNFEIFRQLANAAFAVAFLSILESTSIAKTLAARAGDRVNINQQMFSIGAANMVNAFGSGMAVSGSLTRSMLNFSGGAKTPMASLMSGALIVLGIFTIGPYIQYIPRPALAALVITVGVSLINHEQIKVMIGSTTADGVVFWVTLGSGLIFSLDTAIYLGAATSIGLFLRQASQPELEEITFNDSGELQPLTGEDSAEPEISIVHVEGDLFFGSAEIFLEQTRRLVQNENLKIIILRMRNARHLDATSALAIGELIQFANEQNSYVLVSGAQKEIERVLRKSGIMEVLGEKNFFQYIPDNPNISTRNALKRAQEIIGDEKPNITLFAKSKQDE